MLFHQAREACDQPSRSLWSAEEKPIRTAPIGRCIIDF